jgi:hypothetical protein
MPNCETYRDALDRVKSDVETMAELVGSDPLNCGAEKELCALGMRLIDLSHDLPRRQKEKWQELQNDLEDGIG